MSTSSSKSRNKSHNKFGLRITFALAVTALLAAPAWALPKSDAAAGEQTDALMKHAASGDLDGAFHEAASLGRPKDIGFTDRLDRQLELAHAQAKVLGELRSVRFVEQTHFIEACIERDYRVRYAGGEQSWRFKFRRGAQGWYLYDLYVLGPSA